MSAGRVLATALVLFGLTVLTSLGVWQVRRHGEKQALLASLRARHDQQTHGPELLGLPPEDADFCRVRLRGRVEPGQVALVGGRYVDGVPGVHLITALTVEGAPAGAPPQVLVNWGWVPSDQIAAVAAALGPEVEVDGLARLSAPFDAQAVQAGPGRWRTVAPGPMATALGASTPAWFVTRGPPLGAGERPDARELPAGGYSVALESRPHLEYAATWFGLAATLGVGALVAARRGVGAGPHSGVARSPASS